MKTKWNILLPVLTFALMLCLLCTVAFADECPAGGEHDYYETAHKDATCTAEGYIEWTCSKCDDSYKETLPKTDHQYSNTAHKDPTCGENGYNEWTCDICDYSYKETLPATGDHQEIETAHKDATCTETGYIEWTCEVCDHSRKETLEMIPHDFSVEVPGTAVEATCGTDGKAADMQCSYGCGTVQTGATIAATGEHTFTSYTYNNDATCGDDGTETATCDVCGTATDTRTVPDTATGNHTWGAWQTTVKPTTSKEGLQERTCSVCGAVDTKALAKLPSKPSSGNSKPSSGSSNAAPAVTEAPAAAYGSIVSDVERAEEPYVPETVADASGANTILVITADPDEDGAYTLRNLHITDALLGQLNSEGILTIRFVVGDATVEFPVASYTGDAATTIRGDLDTDVTAFLVTIDPNATTADGTAGVSVGSSVTTDDGAEYDITPLIPDITLTIGDSAAQPVTTASVYTANASAAAPVEEPTPVEEAPAEPALEDSIAA